MNLKSKIALNISLLFTLIFTISTTIIYLLFADFRRDEFESRLREKAISSIKLLVEVKQVDRQLLKLIDEHSIHKLYNEKILIFDASYKLIYSSLDDTKIKWSVNDLKELKSNKTFFRKENENEVYGFFYDSNEKDYFALVSAKDTYGKRKLRYLFYILASTCFVFIVLAWIFSYKLVKNLLRPIDLFHQSVKSITENDLNIQLEVKRNKDEIDLLAVEFNQMLDRINQSYIKQQEFTSNASHELRTPLARLMTQLENKIIEDKKTNIDTAFIQTILSDVTQLSELTNSLILLSKLENKRYGHNVCRTDDVIFDAASIVNGQFKDFRMDFSMHDVENIEINAHKPLLVIAFTNLFKNAYLYSNSKSVVVCLYTLKNRLIVTVQNDGDTISAVEQEKIFEPFMRGENAKNKSGLGLGLRIVKRILMQQGATIQYSISQESLNTFTVVFPLDSF